MAILKFPPVDSADEYGLLAIGGDLEVPSLLLAYRKGIFPWPLAHDGTIAWFCPPQRAVLFFEKFHISRSLRKKYRSGYFSFSINISFNEVIKSCAQQKRKGQGGTWITHEMIEAYCKLHRLGYAHSVESWHEGKLVGGLYGVAIGGMFAGESMFNCISDAGKACLCYLVEYLSSRGISWIDCQQLTPLFRCFGAEEISRDDFLKLHSNAILRAVNLF